MADPVQTLNQQQAQAQHDAFLATLPSELRTHQLVSNMEASVASGDQTGLLALQGQLQALQAQNAASTSSTQEQGLKVVESNADPVARSKAKMEEAEKFLAARFGEKDIPLALAPDQSVKLPVEKVELLTGVNGAENTLDVRVTIKDLNVIGERKAADAVAAVLAEIPALSERFDMSAIGAPKTGAGSEKPVVFSWGPDKSSLDVKLNLKDADPLAVVDQIYAMSVARDGERLRAANSAESATATITQAEAGDPKILGPATAAIVAQQNGKPALSTSESAVEREQQRPESTLAKTA